MRSGLIESGRLPKACLSQNEIDCIVDRHLWFRAFITHFLIALLEC
jgi:hypothetical protein